MGLVGPAPPHVETPRQTTGRAFGLAYKNILSIFAKNKETWLLYRVYESACRNMQASPATGSDRREGDEVLASLAKFAVA